MEALRARVGSLPTKRLRPLLRNLLQTSQMQPTTRTAERVLARHGHSCPFAESHSTSPATVGEELPGVHAATGPTNQCTAAELQAARPYEDIPGPTQWPLLGTAWELMLPRNKHRPLHLVMLDRMRKFGKIYKDKLPGLPETVMIHDPVDVETMFRHEGKLPRRMPLTTWKRVRKELGLGRGVFLQDGEEWRRQRVSIAKFSLLPAKVNEFHEDFNMMTKDLLRNIRQRRHHKSKTLTDAAGLFYKWSFETVSFFVLGKRLGALDKEVPEDCMKFYNSVSDMFQTTETLLTSFPLHKIYPTKTYKKLKAAIKDMHDLSGKYIREKLLEITEDDRRALEKAGTGERAPIPEKVDFMTYIVHSGMSVDKVTLNAVDLLTGGAHPIPFTLAWCLYNLAHCPEVQEKLRREVETVVGSADVITPTHISKMPYLRSCIKETTRLCPVVPGDSRFLQEDAVLSGYRVPAGTLIMVRSLVASRMAELFPEPDKFIPERWTREKHRQTPLAFSVIPFGFGTRMCIGRRVATLLLHIALAQVMQSFRVEYHEPEPVGFVQRIFNLPDREINLTFVDLKQQGSTQHQ